MALLTEPAFGHADRRRIYEYVERHGAVDPEAVREALDLDPRGFRHHVAILKRDGRLEAVDGELRVAFEADATAEHTSDGLAFTIRPARQADLSGLIGAIRQVAAEGTYIVAESVADVIDHEDALFRQDALESRVFFVATVGEEVVGWVHLNAPELEKLGHTAELTLGVIPEYRGMGIGSRLLDRGTEWAADAGYEKLYNSVPATNQAAVRFLEGRGWETEATRADHYKIDGEYVDEIMMGLRVGKP